MNIFNKLFKVLTDSTEEWVSRQEVTTNGRGYVNYICKRPNDLKSIDYILYAFWGCYPTLYILYVKFEK